MDESASSSADTDHTADPAPSQDTGDEDADDGAPQDAASAAETAEADGVQALADGPVKIGATCYATLAEAVAAASAGGNANIHLYGKFINNATDGNGGVYSGNSYLTVYEQAVLTGNCAGGNGGAVYLYGGGVINGLTGTFTGNAAANNGGALWLDGKPPSRGGGHVHGKPRPERRRAVCCRYI